MCHPAKRMTSTKRWMLILHLVSLGDILDLTHSDGDHTMNPMINHPISYLLQRLGVSASDATNYAVKSVKCKPVEAMLLNLAIRLSHLSMDMGTFCELLMDVVVTSNIHGLHAMDLRTDKPNGECWNGIWLRLSDTKSPPSTQASSQAPRLGAWQEAPFQTKNPPPQTDTNTSQSRSQATSSK